MQSAFIRARVAYGCTHFADLRRKFAASREGAGCQQAQGGAVDIKRYAACHIFYVVFFETGGCTTVARCRAFIACIDAGGVLLVGHGRSPLKLQEFYCTSAAA
jgi:hypothetical protein